MAADRSVAGWLWSGGWVEGGGRGCLVSGWVSTTSINSTVKRARDALAAIAVTGFWALVAGWLRVCSAAQDRGYS